MTILFLCRLFYPHIGGVEKHVMEIGKRLIKKGYKVSVITEKLNTSEKGVNNFEVNGINVYQIHVGQNDWFKKFRIWREIWSLRNLFQKADIVHCHDVFFWYLPFRFIYPGKKVFTTFHGYEDYPISRKAVMVRKISEKLSWGNICIGDFIKKWYGTKPDFVSYGAVEITDQTSKIQSKDHSIRESAVFIGRLDEQTGILKYNEAFEIIRKKYSKFRFLVVGDGIFKSMLNKEIKVAGFKEKAEKYFLEYHFAFVSRYLSILEAFATKKLVFAVYDNPVKYDYLKMSPFSKYIICEEDPVKLAEKVNLYLNHPEEEKKMIDNAYQYVKKQTWEAMVELYQTLWKKSSK